MKFAFLTDIVTSTVLPQSLCQHSPGRKRASGGSGGIGGNVYIMGDPDLFSLKFNTYHFNATDGKHGGSESQNLFKCVVVNEVASDLRVSSENCTYCIHCSNVNIFSDNDDSE